MLASNQAIICHLQENSSSATAFSTGTFRAPCEQSGSATPRIAPQYQIVSLQIKT